jgi:hypothetical protein
MEKVTAYKGYAIYANYDAEAPNTEDLILISSKELAQEVLKLLNANPRKYSNLAFINGFEYAKTFQSYEVLREDESDFLHSMEAVIEFHELDQVDDDDDDDSEED